MSLQYAIHICHYSMTLQYVITVCPSYVITVCPSYMSLQYASPICYCSIPLLYVITVCPSYMVQGSTDTGLDGESPGIEWLQKPVDAYVDHTHLGVLVTSSKAPEWWLRVARLQITGYKEQGSRVLVTSRKAPEYWLQVEGSRVLVTSSEATEYWLQVARLQTSPECWSSCECTLDILSVATPAEQILNNRYW